MVDGERLTLAVVDGGMISGWRRSKPALQQLEQAVADLRADHPGLLVAVVADPSLKHSLPAADQVRLETDITTRAIVLAPAGTIGGFGRFLAKVVERADARGLAPIVITDQSVPGAILGQVRQDGGRWAFELGDVVADPTAPPAPVLVSERAAPVLADAPAPRRRRGAGSASGRRGGSDRRPEHQRILDAIAEELATRDSDGSLIGRFGDVVAVGRTAARALLKAAGA